MEDHGNFEALPETQCVASPWDSMFAQGARLGVAGSLRPLPQPIKVTE
jgi:hypothetical protein